MLVIYVILIDITADDQGLIFLCDLHTIMVVYNYVLHIYFFVYLIDCFRFPVSYVSLHVGSFKLH